MAWALKRKAGLGKHRLEVPNRDDEEHAAIDRTYLPADFC